MARLDEFLDVAPTTLRWAVELRDPSWVHDDVFDVLRRHGAALCVHDLLPSIRSCSRPTGPTSGSTAPTPSTTGITVVRRGALTAWAEKLRPQLNGGCDVYAYFNNDWHGAAVQDATLLRRLLRG